MEVRKVSLTAAALDDKETFVLPPLPNSLFSRDSSCWIFNGVSVNPMYWPARRREALNLFAIYRYHPMFAEPDFNWWYPEQGERDSLTCPISGVLRWKAEMSSRSATASS